MPLVQENEAELKIIVNAVQNAYTEALKSFRWYLKMFTLIYNNGQFNRPGTLVPFLQFNIGDNPLLQVDCLTPYKGKETDLIRDICEYLSKVDSSIKVTTILPRLQVLSQTQMVTSLIIL